MEPNLCGVHCRVIKGYSLTQLTFGCVTLCGGLSWALWRVKQHPCLYPINARSTPSMITTDVP